MTNEIKAEGIAATDPIDLTRPERTTPMVVIKMMEHVDRKTKTRWDLLFFGQKANVVLGWQKGDHIQVLRGRVHFRNYKDKFGKWVQVPQIVVYEAQRRLPADRAFAPSVEDEPFSVDVKSRAFQEWDDPTADLVDLEEKK